MQPSTLSNAPRPNRAQRRAQAKLEQQARQHALKQFRKAQAKRARDDGKPCSADQRNDLMTFAWAALDAVPRGEATDIDLSNLAVVTNISRLLCFRGYGDNAEDEIIAGQNAVLSMQAHYDRTGRVIATQEEMQALHTAIDIHEQQMNAGPTRAEMLSLLQEMREANEALRSAP